jgi:hypothetical protein
MDDKFEQGWKLLQRSTPINQKGIVREPAGTFINKEPLCFIITKCQSNSWADDLYQCGRFDDSRRVYH